MRIRFYKSKKQALFFVLLLMLFTPVYAQQINVQGIVVDANDETPLIGVNVVVAGSTKGTVTDLNGNFSLADIPASATLTFKYLGYEDSKVPVSSQTSMNVRLHPAVNNLDEVVVIGYGVVRKRDLTSSIARVDESAIEKTPVTSLDQALQGNAAGVMVITTSAEPGGDMSIRIRGGSSILAGNSPLIVVDGFPSETNDLSMLNPSDILSMEVLKDASATAIYGSRGANGVIMVTTKKGLEGKPKIDFQTKIHNTTVRRTIPMFNGSQYMTYRNLGQQTVGSDMYTLRTDTFPTRDFQQELINPRAIVQDYNLTVSGGGKQMNYLISANVLNQPGLLMNSKFQRVALRGNFNIEMQKDMNLQFMVTNSNTTTQKIAGGDSGGVMRTLMMNPTANLTGAFDGGIIIDEETGEIIYANTEISKSMHTQDINKAWLSDINGAFNWKFVKNLTLRITGGYRVTQRNAFYYVPEGIYLTQANIDKNNIAKRTATTSTKWINENTLTYMNTFEKKHNLTAMIGQSWESAISDGFNGQARGGLDDNFQWNSLRAKVYDSMTAAYSKYNMLSFFGRVIYNYDERYLATLTMRADGSSRFGPDRKFGYFPSASFAWVLTNEKFVPKSDALSMLKLRLSYGMTGNDNIGNYKSWPTLGAAPIVINGVSQIGYIANVTGDPRLGWEETAQANAGLDIGIVKNRFFLTVDVYDKTTKSLLYNYRLPNTTGYSQVATNIGEVQNRGIEFEFNSKNINGKFFKWLTTVNAGYNKGRINNLGGDDNLVAYQMTNTVNTPITYLVVGQPLGTFKGYKLNGVYKDWTDVYSSNSVWYEGALEANMQPGYPKYVDRNGNGVIDEGDKVVLGHAQPDWNLGFTNTFIYRDFDLTVFFNGAFGNSIVNTNKGKLERYSVSGNNQVRYVMNGYRPFDPITGDPGYYNTNIPRAIYSTDYAMNMTDLLVEDGSYFRLKTISLGYTLPKKVAGKMHLSNCRFQISGVNLLTWTKYTGMDPEASSSLGDSNTMLGIDQSSYPANQAVVFSLSLGI
ncbi:MAG: TonB-dependent receptor [Candidatus Azobacteroides sp.]|nr:TonB-dependent receptor [Candidatus Azobacteroides sp.]